MKIHVLVSKAEINPALLSDKVVIVLDILFATSSIVTALANDCKAVIPVRDVHEALKLKKQLPYSSYLYSGELNANTLDGFIQPTPLALINAKINNEYLVYCTTNGTVALNDCQPAKKVYVGSLLNSQAIVQKIIEKDESKTVLIVCSGSNNRFNLEDFYGAGAFVSSFMENSGSKEMHYTDSSLAALQVFNSGTAIEILSKARVGKMMIERSWDHETVFVSQHNHFNICPEFQDNGMIKI